MTSPVIFERRAHGGDAIRRDDADGGERARDELDGSTRRRRVDPTAVPEQTHPRRAEVVRLGRRNWLYDTMRSGLAKTFRLRKSTN